MPSFYSAPVPRQEPQNRFYPPQGANTQTEPPIPGAPVPGYSPAQEQRQPFPQTPVQNIPMQNPNPTMQMQSQTQTQTQTQTQSQSQTQSQGRIPVQESLPIQEQMPMQTQSRRPEQAQQIAMPQVQEHNAMPHRKSGNAMYFEQRYPLMLQRLYDAADACLAAYPKNEFIYDTYPDYLSLRLMRDRMLRENPALTEEFLQAGCPIEWLELLTDAITSELLCRRRRSK
ncbi:MAG: hypothetical protein J1E35_10090 [Lachnospiraceae bacterium]|nr:hypothetical protein [Lachnospiraceae bacterium]